MPDLIRMFRRRRQNHQPARIPSAGQQFNFVDYLDLWSTSHIVLRRRESKSVLRDRRVLRKTMKALNRPVVLERASAMDAEAYVVDFHLQRPNRLGAMHFELLLDPSRNVLSRPDFELEARIDPDLAAILAEEHHDAKSNERGN